MKTFHILSLCILIGYVIIATGTAVILGEWRYGWLPAGCALFLFTYAMMVFGETQMFNASLGNKQSYRDECGVQAVFVLGTAVIYWMGDAPFFLSGTGFHLCWLTVTALEWLLIKKKL